MDGIFPGEGMFGSVIKWYGLLLFFASLFNIFKRIDRIFNNKEIYIFFSFVLWAFFSIVWSQNGLACFYRDMTYLQLFLLYLIIITATDRQNYPLLLKGFVIGALVSLMTIPFSSGAQEVVYMRATGGGMDLNEYASTLAVAMVLALTWILMEKELWKKIIPLVFIPLGLLAITYTKSRTGTLALLPFVIYLFTVFKTKGAGIKILTTFAVLLSVLIFIYLRPEGYVDRVTDINKQSAGERLYIWSVGLKMIANNVILGVGSSNFVAAFPKYAGSLSFSNFALVAHNSLISVFAELGLVGISLFIWLFYSHVRDLLTFLKKDHNNARDNIIAKGLLFALMALMIASMTISYEYKKLMPFLFGSIVLWTKTQSEP